MIPVSRLHVILDAGHTAAYDLAGDIEALLPRDGVVLSGDEVAERQELASRIDALIDMADWTSAADWAARALPLMFEASSLLDSAGEET